MIRINELKSAKRFATGEFNKAQVIAFAHQRASDKITRNETKIRFDDLDKIKQSKLLEDIKKKGGTPIFKQVGTTRTVTGYIIPQKVIRVETKPVKVRIEVPDSVIVPGTTRTKKFLEPDPKMFDSIIMPGKTVKFARPPEAKLTTKDIISFPSKTLDILGEKAKIFVATPEQQKISIEDIPSFKLRGSISPKDSLKSLLSEKEIRDITTSKTEQQKEAIHTTVTTAPFFIPVVGTGLLLVTGTEKLIYGKDLKEKAIGGAEIGLGAFLGVKSFKKFKTPIIEREKILISPKLTAGQTTPRLSKVIRTEEVIDVFGNKLSKSIQKASFTDEILFMGERVIIKQKTILHPIKGKVVFEGVPFSKFNTDYEKAFKLLEKYKIPKTEIKKTLSFKSPKRLKVQLRSQDLSKPFAEVEVISGTQLEKPVVRIKGAVTEKPDVFDVDKLLKIKTRGGRGKVKFLDVKGEILGGKKDIDLIRLSIREQEAILSKSDFAFSKLSKAGKTTTLSEQVTGIKLLKQGEIKKIVGDGIFESVPVDLFAERSLVKQVIPKKRALTGFDDFVLVERELMKPPKISIDMREILGIQAEKVKIPIKPKPFKKIEDFTKTDTKKLIKDLEKIYGKPDKQLLEPVKLEKQLSVSAVSSLKIRPSKQVSKSKVKQVKDILKESAKIEKSLIKPTPLKGISDGLGETRFKDLTGGRIKDLGVSEGRIKSLGVQESRIKFKELEKQQQQDFVKVKNLEKEIIKERVLQKQPSKLKESELLKEKLITKQAERFKLKEILRTDIPSTPLVPRVPRIPRRPRRPPKPPKTPPFIIPPIPDIPKRKETIKKLIKNFEVFTRKAGKDIKITETKDLDVAGRRLTHELKTELRASGFIREKRTQKKVSLKSIIQADKDFRAGITKGEKDFFRIVQKIGGKEGGLGRLSTPEEVFKIKLARGSKQRPSKQKPININNLLKGLPK